jgi:competence protein ComEC
MKGRLRQLVIPVSSAVIMLCIVLIGTALKTDSTDLTLTALDVGQGECVVVTAGRYTAVVDCGSGGNYDAGNILADYLLSIGRTRIDAMTVTHYDSDHVNGVDELMERIDITALFLPEPELCENGMAEEIIRRAAEKKIETVCVREDLRLRLGDADMNIYAPVMEGDENDMCLSCLVSDGGYDALITGDMSMTAERELIRDKPLPDIEILVAGHHGAESSTSTALLETVRPEVVIISVGENSYGHPSEKVLERIGDAGAEVLRTDIMGNVTVTFNEVE